MPKSLVFGELCVDVILFDPASVPVFNTPTWAKKVVIRLGGSASYTAQGLNALGLSVGINSYVGSDWITRHFLDELEAQKIHLDQVLVQQNITTPTCICTSDACKKKFVGCSTFSPYPLSLLELTLEDVNLVYFGGYLLYPELWDGSLAGLFARAKKQALIVVDTQYLPVPASLYKDRALTRQNLQDVDVLLVNRSESLVLTGCKKPQEAAALLATLGPRIVVIKLGDQGCLVWSNQEWFESKSFVTCNNDPVGAGDLFGAAFSYGCLQKWELPAISEFANAYAALCVSRTENVFPNPDTTLAFLNRQYESL